MCSRRSSKSLSALIENNTINPPLIGYVWEGTRKTLPKVKKEGIV